MILFHTWTTNIPGEQNVHKDVFDLLETIDFTLTKEREDFSKELTLYCASVKVYNRFLMVAVSVQQIPYGNGKCATHSMVVVSIHCDTI